MYGLQAGLTDTYAGLPMGLTAEKLANQYGITKLQCDEYSVRLDQRALLHQRGFLHIDKATWFRRKL